MSSTLFIIINRIMSNGRNRHLELQRHKLAAVAAAVAPATWRHAGHALEGAGEGGLRLVADVGRNSRDAVLAVAQPVGCHLHAPARQTIDRRSAPRPA